MSFEYWFMFPVSVLIATTAMASGIGGATFFSPLFILALGLPPNVAIGTGLITEVFGFASGVYVYSRKRLIDYRLGTNLLIITIPMAVFGTRIAGRIEPVILKVIPGVGLFPVALSFLRAPGKSDIARMDIAIEDEFGAEKGETCLTTESGENICYTVCNKSEGRLISGLGGLFVGMISTGMGELNGYFLLQRCKVPSRVSIATSVFVVAVTALSAASGHMIHFINARGSSLETVMKLVVFTVPGVITGAQFGSALASRITQHTLEKGLGILFMLIASLTLTEVIL